MEALKLTIILLITKSPSNFQTTSSNFLSPATNNNQASTKAGVTLESSKTHKTLTGAKDQNAPKG